MPPGPRTPDGLLHEGKELQPSQVDEVVRQLNGIYRSSSLEFALRVGAVIIHHFYDGDADAWRSRGPKLNSFRRLAEHPDLALSAGALYRCVAIFELCDRLRAPSRWRRLGASHLRAVIGIASDKQEYLLDRANEERWSVAVLQAEAQSLRHKRARGGRRANSAFARQLRAVDRYLQQWARAIEATDLQEVESGLQILQRVRLAVEKLVAEFEAQRRRLRTLEHLSPPSADTCPQERALPPDRDHGRPLELTEHGSQCGERGSSNWQSGAGQM